MEMHRYRLKNDGNMKGVHSIRRGKRIVRVSPGEEIQATPAEIGKGFMCRFEDLGEVASSGRRGKSTQSGN